jgi:hypothetical protein
VSWRKLGHRYLVSWRLDDGSQGGKTVGRVGASLLYEFHRQANLERLEIVNGYAKSSKAYAENARIRLARITTATDSTTVILNDIASRQSLRVPKGPTDFVRLEVLEIYPGSRYHDCAVTEVRFFERR